MIAFSSLSGFLIEQAPWLINMLCTSVYLNSELNQYILASIKCLCSALSPMSPIKRLHTFKGDTTYILHRTLDFSIRRLVLSHVQIVGSMHDKTIFTCLFLCWNTVIFRYYGRCRHRLINCILRTKGVTT